MGRRAKNPELPKGDLKIYCISDHSIQVKAKVLSVFAKTQDRVLFDKILKRLVLSQNYQKYDYLEEFNR